MGDVILFRPRISGNLSMPTEQTHVDWVDNSFIFPPYQEESGDILTPDQSGGKMEQCILCGRVTGVEVNLPISKRHGYIEGAGQTCVRCLRQT